MNDQKLRAQSWLISRQYTVRQKLTAAYADAVRASADKVVPYGTLLFADATSATQEGSSYTGGEITASPSEKRFLGCVTTPVGERINTNGEINISTDVEIDFEAYNKYAKEFNAVAGADVLPLLTVKSGMITGTGRLFVSCREW